MQRLGQRCQTAAGMTSQRFDNVAEAGAFERIAPARAPELRADVLVPLCQALVSGIVAGGLWAGGAAALGADFWAVFIASVAIFGGAAWFILLADHRRSLWVRERRESRDIDGDGHVGEPQQSRPPILVNPYRGQRAREADDRAALLETWAEFVRGCAIDTTQRAWERRIGRDQYQEMRDALIDSGWARWRNEADQRAGWELAADPETILAALR